MPKKDRVSIIQGSGSGHEPAHTMIVGPGMLDAACPGDVFAGPPVEFVTETSKLMDTPAGVLYIVNNYTGDRTAWEMAKELCEAEGQKIGYLLVNDDVAVKDSTWTIGRRGVAGNFFVIKAAAAKADKGGTLEECVASARRSSPTSGRWASPSRPARRRSAARRSSRSPTARWKSASASTASRAASGAPRAPPPRSWTCSSTRSCPTCRSRRGDEVAVMVNGLGGTPISELYLLYGIAHKKLAAKGIKVFRSYVGEYCTSLEMAGAHISLLKVDAELKELLLAPAEIAYRVF